MLELATRLRDQMRIGLRQALRLGAWAGVIGLATGAAEAEQIWLAANPLIVNADGGGYLARRSDRIAQMRSTGQRVEIRG